jgi:hypothetical protein
VTAQGTTTTTDPNARSQEFVPVTGGTETTSAELMLVLAYLVMWGLLLAFIGLGWRRQAKVESRIADLERAVGAGKARDP